MRYVALFLGLLVYGSPVSAADIYRCESDTGVHYADEPCSDQAEKITVPDNRIGGDFGQNLPPPREPEAATESEEEREQEQASKDTCRYINSTDLRRYLIRGKVVKGMTKEHVIEAFGRPPETYPTPQETWVYHTGYHGALYELTYVYFREGCVEEVVYRRP